MGNIKSLHPSGNFKPHFQAKKGEVVIYLTYTVNTVAVPRSTGIRVPASDWDNAKERVKPKNKNAFRLNEKLKELREHVDQQLRSYNGPLTPQIMRDIMDGKYEAKETLKFSKDFIQFAKEFNEQRYKLQKISYSTYYNHELYILQFQKFIKNEYGMDVFPISQLTVDMFERYKEYKLAKNNTKEGINKMLTPLFKAVNYAKENGLISMQIAYSITDNYFQLKTRKYESDVEDRVVRYLTPDQLEGFVKLYDQVVHNRTRDYMDMFLFSFHACGLRVSDIITLEWKHIDWERNLLSKNLFKGKVPIDIPLSKPALDILKRWQKKGSNKRFVFDLLSEDFDLNDEAKMDMMRKSKNRTLQMSLNSIGMKMNLKWRLTMHVARHTFAVMALNRGVSLHMISKLLGHSSVTTTEKVYAEFLPSVMQESVRDKLTFGSFLPAV